MSKRDRRLAETRYAGQMSATERAREKEAARQARKAREEADSLAVMRGAVARPRDEASRRRGRSSRRSATDGAGGESFADRDTRGFLYRLRRG